MIITVGGQAASGKTTLAKVLAEKLSFKHLSAGVIMREMAKERNVSLIEFSKYAEEHPEVDREIDERQKKLARGDCVVDGRLSRHFLNPELSIWLIAAAEVRTQRVLRRGERYRTVGDARKDVITRDESERKRYMRYYKIDLGDLSVYDLVINTGRFDIKQMTAIALAAATTLKDRK